MRIRTSLLALALLLPAAVMAGGPSWSVGSATSFSFARQSPPPTSGWRPQAQAGTLIPVAQVGRVGGPTIQFDRPTMYVAPGGSRFFRQQLGDTIRSSVQRQVQVVGVPQATSRRRSRSQGVRIHGVGATSAGYSFPLAD